MALALPAPTAAPQAVERNAGATAARWTGLSAAFALVTTVPLVAMLAGPVADVLFVRGTPQDGSWGYASMLLMVLLAPATYAMFFVTTGEMLKERIHPAAHTRTMRFAAAALVPFMVLAITAVQWTSGPQLPLLITAAMTIPIAMITTIWVSSRHADAPVPSGV